MPRDASDTRRKLLDAASLAFDERPLHLLPRPYETWDGFLLSQVDAEVDDEQRRHPPRLPQDEQQESGNTRQGQEHDERRVQRALVWIHARFVGRLAKRQQARGPNQEAHAAHRAEQHQRRRLGRDRGDRSICLDRGNPENITTAGITIRNIEIQAEE